MFSSGWWTVADSSGTDNRLSKCAQSFRLGTTHSWLEPKPLFPAICPSLPLHSAQHKVNKIIGLRTASPSSNWNNESRHDSQEWEIWDCYKRRLLIFQHRTKKWIPSEQESGREAVCQHICERKEKVTEMGRRDKKGGRTNDPATVAKEGLVAWTSRWHWQAYEKVFTQHSMCQWIR